MPRLIIGIVVRLLACAALLICAAHSQSSGWRPLFDGKSLTNWKESDFFGKGKVTVADGVITLGKGALTGITWDGQLPFLSGNYEIRIEAAKFSGEDFFAGITFPVGDSFCTWINGGWGGTVVGLSSIDGADAAHNDTTFGRKFELNHWYTFRFRVTAAAITAWIDDELVIEQPLPGKYISLREGEIEYSRPFGIASYSTVAGIRKIEWRPVSAER